MRREDCTSTIGDGVDAQEVHRGLVASGKVVVVKVHPEEHVVIYKEPMGGREISVWYHNMPVV